MKKLFVIAALSVFAVACGSSETTEVEVKDTTVVAPITVDSTPVVVDSAALKADSTAKADTTKK